jgi:uncharacterized protein (TIGR03546 family)
MIPFINLPVKIVKLFDSNVSSQEIALGICMGMFMGFIPLKGVMGILLFVCFFLFKINRLTAMLVLPVFKLCYVLGLYHVTDMIGGWLLIDIKPLMYFWNMFTGLPLIAFLDINNTLITGGLVLSTLLFFPVYLISEKGAVILKAKYAEKFGNSKFIKWFKKLPIINKLVVLIDRSRGIV